MREFARYCTQSVLGMLGLSCYILADTYFIAKGLGAQGLAALNLAIPVYSLIHGCGLMLGMGGGTKYAIKKAQGDEQGGGRWFSSAWAWATFSCWRACSAPKGSPRCSEPTPRFFP